MRTSLQLVVVLLSIGLVATLAGCGNDPDHDETQPPPGRTVFSEGDFDASDPARSH